MARAALEGIVHQVDDLVQAMGRDLNCPLLRLKVDGGAAANDLLMQLQADRSGLVVERPRDLETTARGAAMLAGLGAGVFADPEQATQMVQLDRRFDVNTEEPDRSAARKRWADAVVRARS